MMCIAGSQQVYVDGQTSVHRQCAPKLLDQTRGKIRTNHWFGKLAIPQKERSARNIDDNPGQSLVERCIGVGKSGNSRSIAKRFPDSLTEDYADILDTMMWFDLDISGALHVQIEFRMPAQAIQHVIQKWNACVRLDVP